MIQNIVQLHLRHRFFVIVGAILISLYGSWMAIQLPVDVFPDINRPYVTVLVEAHGYAPTDVERLVVFPIESSMSGAPGVESVRSTSGIGVGLITVNFEWGRDIYLCRQIVQERLQVAREQLPEGIHPILAPVAAVTGEIMRVGLTSDGSVDPVELRSIADWELRLRLLSVKGVTQVMPIGGGVKQYEVLVDPKRMAQYGIRISEVEEALSGVNLNTPGGFVNVEGNELVVQNVGRFERMSELEDLVIPSEGNRRIRLRDIASLKEGTMIARGTAGIDGKKAVLLTILKQPGANTLELTKRILVELEQIEISLPKGVTLHTDIYQQANFIQAAVDNVKEALRDGAILVIIVIFLFLMNFRMSLIILTAIPISFICTALVFSWFGITVNTMTLGGLAVAIGELVDSAIVGAENIYRRLRENQKNGDSTRRERIALIARATNEVISSIIVGTIIVLLVVIPLFGLPGVVGRLFAPIGTAYLISITASTVVAIGLTPVLCSLLLGRRLPDVQKDTFVVKVLKKSIEPAVKFSVQFPKLVLMIGLATCLCVLWIASRMGSDLLPDFNEGSVYVIAAAPPGVNLEESSKIGRAIERVMQEVPEIAESHTGRRTGRSEGDEHVMGVNISEIEAQLPERISGDRPREEVLEDLRDRLETIPGIFTEVQQPLQHRISHVISGVRTQIVVRIFGPDLEVLKKLGDEIHGTIKEIPGVVDDSVEQQTLVRQIRIVPRLNELARYRIPLSTVLDTMETALQGKVLSQVQEGSRYFDFVIRAENDLRDHPESIPDLLLHTSSGAQVPLKAVADVKEVYEPNQISHEDSRRRIFVTCNVADRDLGSVVYEIRKRINEEIDLPAGYSWTLGGQYQELVSSTRNMTFLSALALLLIVILLVGVFQSPALATIVMLNIPQAFIGAVLALLITGTNLNMGALVGFVALCGIASRNGILLLSHCVTLIKEEGETFGPEMWLRACKERLTPVLMTALTTNLGLIPLVLAKGEPGKEILYPVAVVIFGGLVTSTLLDFTITPAAGTLYGKKGILHLASTSNEDEQGDLQG